MTCFKKRLSSHRRGSAEKVRSARGFRAPGGPLRGTEKPFGIKGEAAASYILKMAKRSFSIGAFIAVDKAMPSTRRVSSGSMMPSSHRRALA